MALTAIRGGFGSVGQVSGNEPSEAEKDGLEAVRGVVDVIDHKRLEPSGKTGEKTGDWRVWTADGRVADVEVTTFTDPDVRSFSAQLHEKDRSIRTWSDEQLSCQWTVFVFDRDPGTNKKRRPVKKLVECLVSTLAAAEAAGGTPKQMESRARAALDGSPPVSWASHPTITVTDSRGLQINDGEHSQFLYLSSAPQLAGHGRGSVGLVPFVGPRDFAGHELLVSAVQHCIDRKTKKRQLDNAPGLKWLAVSLAGIYAYQLKNLYDGPFSQPPYPMLDIAFDYFDEVWAIARTRIGKDMRAGLVVLCLSESEARQQHHVVSLSEIVVSG